MSLKPSIFERLCFDEDWKVLETDEAKEFKDMYILKCFKIIRTLTRRIDSLSSEELEHFHKLLVQRRVAILEQAYDALSHNRLFFFQPEWMVDCAPLKNGRFSSAEDPFTLHRFVTALPEKKDNNNNVIVGKKRKKETPVSRSDDDLASKNPSENSILKMLDQAREVLGDGFDEVTFRQTLDRYNYNIDSAINATLGF